LDLNFIDELEADINNINEDMIEYYLNLMKLKCLTVQSSSRVFNKDNEFDKILSSDNQLDFNENLDRYNDLLLEMQDLLA